MTRHRRQQWSGQVWTRVILGAAFLAVAAGFIVQALLAG
jgi:hypothetical protein